MISFRQKGDFSKLNRYLERVKEFAEAHELKIIGADNL